MQDAKLPIEFWFETISMAAYLKNCTPTKKYGTVTPIEIWNGKRPSVEHLKVFGSLVYFYTPKTKRNKLEARARNGIFLGYSKSRNAYRVFDPESKDVHEIRTAKFDELKKGHKK